MNIIIKQSLTFFQILQSLSRLLCAISHSGNMIIYCMSSASFRLVLCNKLCLKKQDPLEMSHLQSPYDRNCPAPSREDTVCISFLQSSRHNSTVSQLNTLNSVHLPSPHENSYSSRRNPEQKNRFFNCYKIFQSKRSDISTPIDDVNHGGIEMQTTNI